MTTHPTIALKAGGTVTVLGCDHEHVRLETSFASPPGSSIELVFANAPLSVKVRSCRRVEAGATPRFTIEGRWVSLSRAQREALPR